MLEPSPEELAQSLRDRYRRCNANRDKGLKSMNNAKYYAEHKEEIKLKRLQEKEFNPVEDILGARQPIDVELDKAMLTSDWHVPFHDLILQHRMNRTAREQGICNLVIGGDFWDCDSYSRFTHLSPGCMFKEEANHIKEVLAEELAVFDHIYICRGNHEKRFIDANAGKLTLFEMFELAMPDDITKAEFKRRVHITMDDFLYVTSGGERWRISHPRNYRITNLSVVRDLAAKFGCHQFGAHGHQFAQGHDRSGRFQVVDGGGLFDPEALDYLRETTAYPQTKTGYYTLMHGVATPYLGK